MYGDFEDLETGEMHKSGMEKEEQESDVESGGELEKEDNEIAEQEKRLEKKKKLKAAFNAKYP